jgi:hypothetical protein
MILSKILAERVAVSGHRAVAPENKTLFKFSGADGAIAILRHNSLFITSPLDLNDPFEMRPAWTDAHQERHSANIAKRDEIMTGMPVFAALEGNDLVPIGPLPKLEEQDIGPVDSHRGLADQHNQRVFEVLHERYRVASFSLDIADLHSSSPESKEEITLMWAHYSDSFQGICLAFDPTKFANGIREGGFPVGYNDEREALPPYFYDSFLEAASPCLDLDGLPFRQHPESGLWIPAHAYAELQEEPVLKILTHKSPAWKHENEVRMIYDLAKETGKKNCSKFRSGCSACQKAGKRLEECENVRYRDTVSIPPEAVIAVVFGTDTSQAKTEETLQILAEERYAHVEVFWSALHSDQHKIQYCRDRMLPDGTRYSQFIQRSREMNISRAKRHIVFKENETVFKAAAKGINYENYPKRED